MHNPLGWTLRNYFAAAALTGIAAGGFGEESVYMHQDTEECDTESQAFALIAYRLADAMLAEREKLLNEEPPTVAMDLGAFDDFVKWRKEMLDKV